MLVNRIILCRVKFGQRWALYALWLKKSPGSCCSILNWIHF